MLLLFFCSIRAHAVYGIRCVFFQRHIVEVLFNSEAKLRFKETICASTQVRAMYKQTPREKHCKKSYKIQLHSYYVAVLRCSKYRNAFVPHTGYSWNSDLYRFVIFLIKSRLERYLNPFKFTRCAQIDCEILEWKK